MSALTTSPTRELFVFLLLAVALGVSALLGHEPADRCPECGHDVRLSDDGEWQVECAGCGWSRPVGEVEP